jgi:hypothetical protein
LLLNLSLHVDEWPSYATFTHKYTCVTLWTTDFCL